MLCIDHGVSVCVFDVCMKPAIGREHIDQAFHKGGRS